jgi:hypothetical protein
VMDRRTIVALHLPPTMLGIVVLLCSRIA